MSRGRLVALSMVLAGLSSALVPATAPARTAYVTGGAQEGSASYAVPVDLGAAKAGTQVAIGGGEGAPPDVAITPDGKTAYVPNGSNSVVPIDVATNKAGTPIVVGSPGTEAIAITPDGKTAYVTSGFSGSTVTPIDVASGTAGSAITVGTAPRGIAITPNGARAYVTNYLSGSVSVIDLATKAVVATIPLGATTFPVGTAVTPDGSTVYVADSEGVVPIKTATNTAGAAIPGSGPEDFELSITPNGARAYALNSSGQVIPIELGPASSGAGIVLPAFPNDIAILPDGSRAYATTGYPLEQLVPIDIATNTAGTPFGVGEGPVAIAIVPNQPPHAAFTSSPGSPKPGANVAFDGSGSTDSDGSVARYEWDFGDGTVVQSGGAKPSHAYAKAGTYQVTLTTTDNEGCSLTLVFTGQTAYCNGSSVARVTHPVTVVDSCPKVEGTATSFVPKLVSHHVVPGVRVRLAVNKPAHLEVEATLLWSLEDESGRADLGNLSVNVKHWRRVRFPIPAELRHRLPLGTPVKVSLHIHATPLGGDACAGHNTHPTLRVHVVKVIPDAVQSKRPR